MRENKLRLVKPFLELRCAPYPIWIHVYVSRRTFERALKVGSRGKLLYNASGATGVCARIHGVNGHLFLGIFESRQSTLVHELYHAMRYIVQYVDMPDDWITSEPGAHLIGYLYEQCQPAIEHHVAAAAKASRARRGVR